MEFFMKLGLIWQLIGVFALGLVGIITIGFVGLKSIINDKSTSPLVKLVL